MSGKDEGVFVPRRIIIIVILVSLCVNVFFLMMGILIGKDDLKWQADQEDKPQEQAEQVAQSNTSQDSLDKDLMLFDGDPVDQDTRRPPIPEEAVKHDGTANPITSSAPETEQPTLATPEPETVPVTKPEIKPETKPEAKPETKREEPVKAQPPKVEPKPAPVKTETAKVEPPKKETPPSNSGYWIQMMAIADQAKAKEFLQRAKNKGYNGTIISEKGLWKVRIGPYSERAAADKARDQANAALGVGGWVIQK
jgi:cell division septation protein DedD